MTSASHRVAPAPRWVLVAAIVLMAANLRTLMASLPPLAESVRDDLGLSSLAMGVLTTLPVLCMGLLAPGAVQVARRVGPWAAVASGVACVLVGLVLRGFAGSSVPALYAGTFVAGAGIALTGTLLPGVVKAVFPAHRSGLGTGLTMGSMMGAAALASAGAVPLADALGGWSASMLSWAPLAGVGLLAWFAVRRGIRASTTADTASDGGSHALPWRSATAWLLAGYLTVQSWQFYSSLAWLAPTYESHGWTARDAGLLMAVFTGAQLVSGLVAPALLDKVPDARVLLVVAGLLGGSGEVGVWLAPDAAPWVWALLLGAGQGAAFALGLGLLVRYAVTSRDSARLTAMCFLVSYSVAAFGPAASGAVEDLAGGFGPVWALLALVMVPQLLAALRLGPSLARVGSDGG
ncbi:CynX/NimT family MFS transporter [Oryzobacter terrae]|uniref:MFS transporter n=1 Tax=Oryzobacter terrae TaxID=1620385 RepID=UPI00367333BF